MTRQEFKEKAKESIDELTSQVNRIEHKAQEISGEAQAEIQKKLKTLREQKDTLIGQYEQLQQATEENWENLQNAFTKGVRAFKQTLEQ